MRPFPRSPLAITFGLALLLGSLLPAVADDVWVGQILRNAAGSNHNAAGGVISTPDSMMLPRPGEAASAAQGTGLLQTSASEGSIIDIQQTGSVNRLTISQSGQGHSFVAVQAGDNSTIDAVMLGSQNTLTLQQTGSGQSIVTAQSGYGNQLSAVQIGQGNVLRALQR